MAKDKAGKDAHQKAHDLAEAGIETALEGDKAADQRMVDEAKRLDPAAVEDLGKEVEQEQMQAETFARQQQPPAGADKS